MDPFFSSAPTHADDQSHGTPVVRTALLHPAMADQEGV